MLAAILKKKVNNGISGVKSILYKKNCVEIRRFDFLPAAILEIAAMLAAILKNNLAHDARSVLKMLCAKRQSDPTFRLVVMEGRTDRHTHTHTDRQTDRQTPSKKCFPFYPCWTQD